MKTTQSPIFPAALCSVALLLASCSKANPDRLAVPTPVPAVVAAAAVVNADRVQPIAMIPAPAVKAAALMKAPVKTPALDERETVPPARPAPVITHAIEAPAPDSWASIKDNNYESRDNFITVLDRMAAKSDGEMHALNNAFNGLPDPNAEARESEVAEFNDAMNSLKADLDNLRAGTTETWAEDKARVVQSWMHVQADHDALMAKFTTVRGEPNFK